MQRTLALTILAAAGLALATAGASGQGFPQFLLDLKQRFHSSEAAMLAEPFIGVHTSDGVREGLFPLAVTGVSTAPVREAASAFLDTLSPTQLMRTHFWVGDDEWRRWLNVSNGIYARQGTPLAEMSAEQRAAAMALLAASLSARGLDQAQAIMLTDQALKELNPARADTYDPQLYYFTVMGTPSATQPWGWQLDGHHLVINFFVLGDQVVMTPAFWGGEPAVSRHGSTAGNAVMQRQQDLGLALARSLSASQMGQALLGERKQPGSMIAGAHQDNLQIDFAGLPARALDARQQRMLTELIGSYVGLMRDGHAAVRMQEVAAHLAETHFAWEGATGDDAAFYYRIHSPVLLIEFDHQQPAGTTMLNTPGVPTRDHIHTIVRTPNGNDYGKDLLAQHLAQAHLP